MGLLWELNLGALGIGCDHLKGLTETFLHLKMPQIPKSVFVGSCDSCGLTLTRARQQNTKGQVIRLPGDLAPAKEQTTPAALAFFDELPG